MQTKTVTIVKSGLQLALDGSFQPWEALRVTALVNKSLAEQVVTLELPEGLERLEGEAKQAVSALPAGSASETSSVVWQVRVKQPGKYSLKVLSSTGAAQTKVLTITRPEGSARSPTDPNIFK